MTTFSRIFIVISFLLQVLLFLAYQPDVIGHDEFFNSLWHMDGIIALFQGRDLLKGALVKEIGQLDKELLQARRSHNLDHSGSLFFLIPEGMHDAPRFDDGVPCTLPDNLIANQQADAAFQHDHILIG
ncbi:hypothetical protein KSD_84030 [Ktedonobacter sp. SOSP1-85]|nr:hypothetical protein [Ktedonobacter sp. SOSP1-85]GHO80632.1 hypothetical protein KSD_84030 [Ktedonobacter sp. SOSP1-85]